MQDLKITKGWERYGDTEYQLHAHFPFSSNEYDKISNWTQSLYGGMFVRSRLKGGNLASLEVIDNAGYMVGGAINIKCQDPILSVFWCANGYIGVLSCEPKITIYTGFGDVVNTYYPPSPNKIMVYKPFYGGIAFVNDAYDLVTFSSDSDGFINYGKLDGTSEPVCIDFAPEALRGYVALENSKIVSFTMDSVQVIDKAPFIPTAISCHSSGKIVGVISENKFYATSAISKDSMQYSTKLRIGSFAWVDEKTAIIIQKADPSQRGSINPELIQLKQSASHIIPVPGALFAVSDLGGCRVYGRDAFTLTAVPRALSQLVIPSTALRVSQLLKARENYDNKVRCDHIFEEQRDSMPGIVSTIIAAAPHIFDVNAVVRLLDAAALAKSQITGFSHDSFADAVVRIRFLMSMRRQRGIGPEGELGFSFVTTAEQFEACGVERLVSMFSQLRFFGLAGALAEQMGEEQTPIAEAWARSVIGQYGGIPRIPDVLQVIGPIPGIDYLALARFAQSKGAPREYVAMIVRRNNDPVRSVEFLEDAWNGDQDGEREIAAILSETKDGSAVLRHTAVVRERHRRMKADERTLANLTKNYLTSSPLVTDMYVAYRRFVTIENLGELGLNGNRLAEMTFIHTTPPDRFGRDPRQIQAAEERLGKGSPYIDAIQRHIQALSAAESAPQILGTNGAGPSPRQLMERALVEDRGRIFDKIASAFGVDKGTIAYTKMHTYVKYARKAPRMMEELKKFCHHCDKRYCIPFSDIAFAGGIPEASRALLQRAPNDSAKLDKLMEFEMWAEAAQVALAMKNEDLANQLLAKAEAVQQ